MTPAKDVLGPVLAAHVGKRLPGGRPDCDAYQTVRQDEPGVWRLTGHHDDTCPSYRRHVANRADRRRAARADRRRRRGAQ